MYIYICVYVYIYIYIRVSISDRHILRCVIISMQVTSRCVGACLDTYTDTQIRRYTCAHTYLHMTCPHPHTY